MLIVEHMSGGVGGVGTVFKSVVVHSKMLMLVNVHAQVMLLCYGPGMPCTGTSVGKTPDRWQKHAGFCTMRRRLQVVQGNILRPVHRFADVDVI